MLFSMIRKDPLLKMISNSLLDLACTTNINNFWNFGFLLGMCLSTQLITGIFLAMHYTSDISTAFNSVIHISRDVNFGWGLRMIHANGASMFFICLYIHIGRGMYYSSYTLMHVWSIGTTILLVTMASAFLGYVLPWGQMSFWGATVITNLFSAFPYFGEELVNWIWGGFAVDNATLTRFFTFHFLFPFILTALVMIHLMYLHNAGSSNPLGINGGLDKIKFYPYFFIKDLMGLMLMYLTFMFIVFFYPWLLGDPENFIPANPLVTPVHIQPEWYFLFAYAILRSIPNKLGGVLALFASVMILWTLPLYPYTKFLSNQYYFLNKFLFWVFINIIILLTWIGARPVEDPYIITGQILTILYFAYYMMFPFLMKMWDNLLN